jgi:DNA polymerase-1
MPDFDKKTVYIIDSYGLIYRSYFAFISRPLINQKGQNISALFGFFRNLHAVLTHYQPEYILAALDSKTPTFRHKMYDQYKATRQKTPEDLHAQIPWIEEILHALGIPVLQCDGYEADDVIATVARICTETGRTCRILTADKDLMQLVNDSTQILKPDRQDIWKVTGVNGVTAEWGVPPEKMLDLLSLTGDSADNIPGVKGVGIKTAVKLLTQYGDLDGLFDHADEIKGSIGQKIRDGKDNAYFSQKLIRLNYEVPFLCRDGSPAAELDEIKPTELNYTAAAELLKFYGAFAVAKQFATITDPAENSGSAAAGKNTTSARDSGKPADPDHADITPLHKNSGNYQAVTNTAVLTAFVDGILSSKKTAAFDCETDSLNTREAALVGFSLSVTAGEGIYVPLILNGSLFEDPLISKQDALSQIGRLFAAGNVTIIMHNGKFDYEVLRTAGLKFGNEENDSPSCKIVDTMIAAWLLEPDSIGRSPYSLEHLAQTKLALVGTEYTELVAKGQTFADVPLEQAAAYGAEDADFTLQLWNYLEPYLEKQNLLPLFDNIEMPLLPVLAEMELRGIHLDQQALTGYNRELTTELEKTQNSIYEIVGHQFNISSTKQLQEVLFTERGLKPGKKTKTGYSTDTAVLENLAVWDPVPKKILEYRTLAKLQSTYVEALPLLADQNSRIHTSFMQTGTATGRLSSRDPNLQNIPIREEAGRRIRSAFTAAPGTVLISADYAQIELVVLAHLSKDPNLCKAFNEGKDVHASTASLIYNVPPEQVTHEMRRTAKTINFGVMYGMSAFRLSNTLGIPRTQAAAFIENYFRTYAAVREFIDRTVKKAEQTGYVETLFGRRRRILNINSRNKTEKAGAERIAVNTPIQGSAADIVKKAMIDLSESLKKTPTGAHLLLQVHDELIMECPDDTTAIENTISILKHDMENAVQLAIPLRVAVEYGKNWGDFH